jgi:PAS domain-containing protein
VDPPVNSAYCGLTGYERDEPLSMNIADLPHPADQAADREHAALIRRGQAPVKGGDDYAYQPLGAAHCLQTREDLAGGRPRVSACSGQFIGAPASSARF